MRRCSRCGDVRRSILRAGKVPPYQEKAQCRKGSILHGGILCAGEPEGSSRVSGTREPAPSGEAVLFMERILRRGGLLEYPEVPMGVLCAREAALRLRRWACKNACGRRAAQGKARSGPFCPEKFCLINFLYSCKLVPPHPKTGGVPCLTE